VSGAPLLAAEGARVAIDDVVAIDRLTLVTHGDRVVLAGDPGALVAAVTGVPRSSLGRDRVELAADTPTTRTGEAHVTAGRLLLAGRNVGEGAHRAIMGAAPLDPPLPPDWTAAEYVAWSARLGGATRRAALELAEVALAQAGLREAGRRRALSLALPERRVISLAQAAALSPEVIVAEAPLAGLEGDAASFVLTALQRFTEGRRALVTVLRLDPGSPEGALARSADHVIVLAGGEIAVEGAPVDLYAGARIYALTVHQNAPSFQAELALRGIDLRGGPRRFSANLPAGTSPRELLLAAQIARATLVELVPILG
jgi:ABC-2 type transport system ATP-binding protein